MGKARSLLRRAAVQFRLYESSHRGKVAKFEAQRPITVAEQYEVSRLIEDTLEKAEVNRKMAEEIEAYLDSPDAQ